MIKIKNFFKREDRFIIIAFILCIVFLGGQAITRGIENYNNAKPLVPGSLEMLLKYKTNYVGNNSNVITLLDNLNYKEFKGVTSLKTKEKPYGISVNYNFGMVNILPAEVYKGLRYNAIMLFSLINNVDVINFNLTGSLITHYEFKRTTIQEGFLRDIRQYSKDVTSLNVLKNIINYVIYISPEKYSLSMSSIPGIQIGTNQIKGTTIKYITNKGNFLTWDVQSGKIKNYGKAVHFNKSMPIYWTPLNDKSIGKGKTYISIIIINKQGNLLIEKRIEIVGSSLFTVINRPDIIVKVKKNTK